MTGMRRPRVASWTCAVSACLGVAAVARTMTLLDLQPRLAASTTVLVDGRSARLVDPAPAIGRWYLLTLDAGTPREENYHLEAAEPLAEPPRVDPASAGRLLVRYRLGDVCGLTLQALATARRQGAAFGALCGGRMFLRNAVHGRRTALEATTEFLRDHVWGGERIIGFVRQQFYQDAFALHGDEGPAQAQPAVSTVPPPRLRPGMTDRVVVPTDLGIDVGAASQGMRIGQWVPARGRAGVFVSLLLPSAIDGGPRLPGHPDWRPDAVEADSLDLFVAFDLSRFDVGFALGTEHPRLGWSDHAAPAMLTSGLPGPDGIASAEPLVRAGMLSPADLPRAVATFTGGFKREHGAFRHGPLAMVNHSSHYGFIEQGVVFSKLSPGLSTLTVSQEGDVDIRTWRAGDVSGTPALRFARQNGVPLVETDAAGAASLGAYVDQWGPGNWSGSADEHLRTLRAGACILQRGSDRYLVYGYFSTATPGTMARVFLALGCRDAMHLDMNALEHTYLALYEHAGDRIAVQHLVQGMAVLDQEVDRRLAPRFLAFPDDRDFFYLLEKAPATQAH